MTDAYETLLVTREPGGLMFCTLNRPQALNAMSPKLVDELHAFLDALHDDTDTRVVILRGAGRGFCAGLDLREQSGGGATLRPSVSTSLRGQHKIAELVIKMERILAGESTERTAVTVEEVTRRELDRWLVPAGATDVGHDDDE